MTDKARRVLISGAGIAGLSLAQRLSSYGWSVVVVERATRPRRQGYMIDFFGLGYDAAERMGLVARLRELAHDITELAYVDDTGKTRAAADYGRFSRGQDGRLLSLMRPDLELALRESLPPDVDVRFGCTVTAIDNRQAGVAVELSTGDVVEADLLVGADGVHSAVRGQVFGDEARFLRYLGLHTAAFTFDDSSLRDRLSQRLVLTDSVDRMMGLYGLPDGQVAAFAVHRSPVADLPDDARATLVATHSTLGWHVPRALERMPAADELYYDLVAQIEMPQWHRARVVLVGDACQAVSLVAGQGASLAVAGAFVLAEQLHAADSVPEALVRYQSLWRPVVTATQRSGRRGIEWFLPSSRARRTLRRALLRITALRVLERFATTAFVGKQHASVAELSRPPESREPTTRSSAAGGKAST